MFTDEINDIKNIINDIESDLMKILSKTTYLYPERTYIGTNYSIKDLQDNLKEIINKF